ncbi:hypothetical protein BVX99_02825 [bacterium F16]|nr:hypothetical protein BVX99_02825 [bacterium F16]
MLQLPTSRGDRLKLVFLAGVVIFGGISGGCHIGSLLRSQRDARAGIFGPHPQFRLMNRIPTSTRPGPKRFANRQLAFTLDDQNSVRMTGRDEPDTERWCDIADHFYTRRFVAGYSNRNSVVRVSISARGPSFKGRLEATGLKPNFAYQIKLAGDFSDRRGFEFIGKVGRWRLPGLGTNYTDLDYETYPDDEKHTVEAYILFDYFVTNRDGEAVRDFELDSSLHVLWRNDQDDTGIEENTATIYSIDASDTTVYSSPVYQPVEVGIWAECELARYDSPDQIITLPPNTYTARLILTEESFHSFESDGGYWATVFQMPVTFTIEERD